MYNNEMPSLFNFTYTPCRRGAKTYAWLTNDRAQHPEERPVVMEL